MDLVNKKLTCDFQFKNVQDEDPEFVTFEGYASTFSKDLVNDIIMPGAFSKTVNSNTQIPILFEHDTSMPIGKSVELREDEKGLFIKGKLPRADTFVSGRILPQMSVGSLQKMSIGFSMKREGFEYKDNIRYIKALDLHECSFVVQPAQPEAQITAFKAAPADTSLPLAPSDTTWDGDKAEHDIRKATNSEESPSPDYSKYFFWYDKDNPDNFSSYKMPFAMNIGGQLKAVPAAINAANSAMSGARGGVKIPGSDKSKVQSDIDVYRKKMGVGEFADNGKSFYTVQEIKNMSPRELEQIFKDCGIFSNKTAKYLTASIDKSQCEADFYAEDTQCDAEQDSDKETVSQLDKLKKSIQDMSMIRVLNSIKI